MKTLIDKIALDECVSVFVCISVFPFIEIFILTFLYKPYILTHIVRICLVIRDCLRDVWGFRCEYSQITFQLPQICVIPFGWALRTRGGTSYIQVR